MSMLRVMSNGQPRAAQRWQYLYGGHPVMITPDTAKQLLQANDKNRKVQKPRVMEHARRLKEGTFEAIPDPLMLTGTSLEDPQRLLNGQHRLTAIILTGIAAPMVIVGYCDPSLMPAIDTGKARSASDVLMLDGHTYSVELSAAVRVLEPLTKGRTSINNSGIVTASDITRLLVKYPGLQDSVTHVKARKFKGLDVSIGSALHWVFCHDDKALADQFFEDLLKADGKNGSASPVVALKYQLTNGAAKGPLGRKPKLAWMIEAWEAYVFNVMMPVEKTRAGKDRVKWWDDDKGDAFPWGALPKSIFQTRVEEVPQDEDDE